MSFEENFNQYLDKLKRTESQLSDLTEESTKTSLVMPFFALLGYDVFNASEFMPEYTCDVATKKGEKVDYAILKDGEPIMLIEVKRAGMKLQKQQQGQLFRYFSTNRCRIAILTNGITYHFFSDLNAANIMDDEPFLSFNLLEDDASIYLSSLKQFHKEKFEVKSVISKAVFQKYQKVVEKTLKQDLLNPSDEIVKYFLSRPEVKTGNRITAQMIEKHREVTLKAMRKVLGVKISQPNSDGSLDADQNIISEKTSQPIDLPPVTEETVPAPTKSSPKTVESIIGKIKSTCESAIPDFSCTPEEKHDSVKLHIYTTGGRKIGIAQIMRPDMSIQIKRIGGQYIDVPDVEQAATILMQ